MSAIAAAFVLLHSASAGARITCAYSGPPSNVLSIVVTGDSTGEVTRSDRNITVREYASTGPAVRCGAEQPTVLNTDTIDIVVKDITNVLLELAGGPFAPGATTEPEGASEIEIQTSGKDGYVEVVGTPRDDVFHWGFGGANPGLNLNPGEAGDHDVDVMSKSTREQYPPIQADGAEGDDTIIVPPGAVIHGSLSAGGGDGDDRLTGSPQKDLLDGGAGNDDIEGAAGADLLEGGRGRDRLSGGAGADIIKSRDATRDTVTCGAGRDRVHADRRDIARGCERIIRR